MVAGGAAGVTALRFEDEAGMLVAAGGGDGVVRVYDLRSSRPMVVKDHNSGAVPTSQRWRYPRSEPRTRRLSFGLACRFFLAGFWISNLEANILNHQVSR